MNLGDFNEVRTSTNLVMTYFFYVIMYWALKKTFKPVIRNKHKKT